MRRQRRLGQPWPPKEAWREPSTRSPPLLGFGWSSSERRRERESSRDGDDEERERVIGVFIGEV